MANSDDDPETLSTGMESLDNQLDGNGLYPGTVVTVLAPPNSSSEHLLYNLIGGRDTHYLSMVRDPDTIEQTLHEVSPNMRVTIDYIDEFPPTEQAVAALEDADLPEGGTVVVDPVNFLERDDPAAYRNFVAAFRDAVKDAGCLGIIHANMESTDPDLRWLTLQMSDAIFRIQHSETNEEVEDHLLIPKLYGGQALDERSFKLPHSLKIDVGTKESIKA